MTEYFRAPSPMPFKFELGAKHHEATEALKAWNDATTAEDREHRGHDFVTASTHAALEKMFVDEGLRTEEQVAPRLRKVQDNIRSMVGMAVGNQDRWIERCFFGRLRYLAANIGPGGSA